MAEQLGYSFLTRYLQPVCIAIVHFTEIICCKIQKLLTFRLYLKIGLYLHNLRQKQAVVPFLKETYIQSLLSNRVISFEISLFSAVKCMIAMHTGCRCPFNTKEMMLTS